MTEKTLLALQRLKNHLLENVVPLVKLKDFTQEKLDKLDKSQIETMKLSRSLSAFVLSKLTDGTLETSVGSITDGFDDDGIDAIYIDESEKKIYISQAKWFSKGNKSPDLDSILRFIHGVQDVIDFKLDKWNERMLAMKDRIKRALVNPDYKIELIIVYTGSQPLSDKVKSVLQDFETRQNPAGVELVSSLSVNLTQLYKLLIDQKDEIDVDNFIINEWAEKRDPFKAYSGAVTADQLFRLWDENRNNLFSRNIRYLLSKGDIHTEISETLQDNPEKFWYFNNGITVLCKSIRKAGVNGSNRNYGVFSIKDFSIVNGAQTVGTLGKFFEENKDADPAKVEVFIRVIEVTDASDELGKEITRANNRQNKIDARDFVSLDNFQQELAEELRLSSVEYIYKRSEDERNFDPLDHMSIEELARALSNQYKETLDFAIDYHRGPSSIFEGVRKNTKYSQLFSTKNVNGYKAWNLVRFMRLVDSEIKQIDGSEKSSDYHGILTFGDYLLEAVLFSEKTDFFDIKNNRSNEEVEGLRDYVHKRLIEVIEKILEYEKSTPSDAGRTWTAKFKTYTYPKTLFKYLMNDESLASTSEDLKSQIENKFVNTNPKTVKQVLDFVSNVPEADKLGKRTFEFWLNNLYDDKKYQLGGVKNIQQYNSKKNLNVETDFLFRMKYDGAITFEFKYSYYGKNYVSSLYSEDGFKGWISKISVNDKLVINSEGKLLEFSEGIQKYLDLINN